MLFHNWTPPPIMITKEKLNTYPPLFSNSLPQRRGRLFACGLECLIYKGFRDLTILILLKSLLNIHFILNFILNFFITR